MQFSENKQGWTSENKNVDDCIKKFQLNGTNYEDIVEWIPFNRLNIIQKFDDGFLATWLDGVRDAKYIRYDALKEISGNKDVDDCIKKFLFNATTYEDIIEWIPFDRLDNIQEIAKEDSNAYFQQSVNSGNFHQYLRINFKKLTWKDKLLRLTDISKDLIQIHEAGYTHCYFHSAADIYGFGVVVAEITTGIPLFDLFDNDLALKICGGLRLKFAPGTPDCYIKLAKLYMNSDPQKWPTAKVLFDEFSK
ncbi:hypothetical protein C2G38_2207414 [Gigaspora rosea]|uniref:Protein kinase domain-containing protein n=1 Tax=Gigaspora rosea TaxID=44941 RepID=A0A397URZ5_9GLOM|nr:hypothetical protein C2G38_2207414 [Gigaspora rosea]